jgi:hypothetical protein
MSSSCISSDSSFYICFSDDLDRRSLLDKVTSAYQFHLGDRIRSELPTALRRDAIFMSRLRHSSYDYFQIIKPFFGRNSRHEKDGEYEAIGIGHHLNEQRILGYLILDDKRARTFVKTHFPNLQSRMVGTLGFIRDSCCQDGVVHPFEAISILDEIKSTALTGMKTRPCGIDMARYNEIVGPIVTRIRKMAGLSG